MYGAGPNKIAETANISREESKDFIRKYFNQASSLKQWIDYNLDFIENNSYVYSAFGRKRRLPEVRSPNRGVATHASRSGLNFLIQSVASDINLLGLNDTIDWVKTNRLQEEVKIFATVHDSIVAEVRNDMLQDYTTELVKNLQKPRMEEVVIDGCPIGVDVEVGPNWGELSAYSG